MEGVLATDPSPEALRRSFGATLRGDESPRMTLRPPLPELKTLAGDVSNETRLSRFKRELSLARKVTHPNVCRLFDLGFHERSHGAER